MNNYISIKGILDRLLRHPLMQDLQFETAVDYTVDFMRIVGNPKMFEEIVVKKKVNNYRVELSDLNIYKIIGVRQGDIYFKYADNCFHPALLDDKDLEELTPQDEQEILKKNGIESEILPSYIGVKDYFKYMCTFEFVNKMKVYYQNNSTNNTPTYKIQGNCLFTSILEGEIELAYIGIKTDEEGFPMLLDNSSYLRALELYIKKQWFTILFDMGKIQGPVLQNVQQEYAWAVGDCESEFNRMTVDQAEYFYSTMKNIHNESYGFKYLGG